MADVYYGMDESAANQIDGWIGNPRPPTIDDAVAPWWTTLLDLSLSVVTPVTCWSFDDSLTTKVGSKISVTPDIWGLGTIPHHATQGVDANRATQVGNTGRFAVAATSRMVCDFSTGEASGDWTFLFLMDVTTAAAQDFWFDAGTGRLAFWSNAATKNACFDGTLDRGAQAVVTGAQALLFSMSNGTGRIDRNGVNLDNTLGFTQRPIGGNVIIGNQNAGAAFYANADITGICIWKNKNDADSAKIMAAGQAIMGT